MASNINPGNINQDYPVSGQDNDSQGFRDNFTNIRTNFTETKTEIEDLQTKAVLKSALTGGTLDNNMNGSTISSVVLQDAREIVINNSSAQSLTSIDVKAGSYYKLTSTNNMELTFVNWPVASQTSSVVVSIKVTEITAGSGVLPTVTIPVSADESAMGLHGYHNNAFHFRNEGIYIYEFSTTDAGATIQVHEVTAKPTNFYRATVTPVGQPGDTQGMMAFNDTTSFYCIENYDGAASIWVESVIANSDPSKVDIAGDTMTGPLVLNADPTLALGAATKLYVDTEDALKLDLVGGIMTGNLVLNSDPTSDPMAATKLYVDTENLKLHNEEVPASNKGVSGDLAGMIAHVIDETVDTSFIYTCTHDFEADVHEEDIIIGRLYEIDVPGTTDWTLVGAANNNSGTIFTATAVGSGTDGTVLPIIWIRSIANWNW